MLAVIKEDTGPSFSIKEVPRPLCREDDVIIKVRTVGVCGSDLPILGGTREVPLPLIPGHEFAGVVAQVGERVTDFQVGDRVTSCLVVACGNCKYCVEGKENLCDQLLETGIHIDGAFAEYVRVPARTCVKLREETSFDVGASIDPVASAYRTIKAMQPSPLDTVVVMGPGPIGLYAVQLLRLYGVANIIMLGTTSARLDLALELGAHHAVNHAGEDAMSRVLELTDGKLADFVLDCAGGPSLVPLALNCLKKGGTYAIAGLFHEHVPLDLGKVVRREIQVMGTICYTREEFRECLSLVESGRIQILPLTHLPLRDMAQALELSRSKQAIKVMLHP